MSGLRRWFYSALAIVGALLCVSLPKPVHAEVPDGFRVCLEPTCNDGEVVMGEWVQRAGYNQANDISFYMRFPENMQNGCIYVEFAYHHEGSSLTQFWAGGAGIRMVIDRNSFQGTGQHITFAGIADDEIALSTVSGTTIGDVAFIYPPHPKSLNATGSGYGTACVTDSDGGRPARVILRNVDGTAYEATFATSMRWFATPPTPPEPSLHCPDGTEIISDTITIAAGSAWSESVVLTDTNRVTVRYTLSDTMAGGSILHQVKLRVNDTQVTRRFYTDEMHVWDPVELWSDDPFSFMVPNIDDPAYSDYQPGAYETGPELELYAGSYNAIDLVSVCVIPALTSEWCPDGIEALTATPMYLPEASGAWERRLEEDMLTDLTHFVVRYRVAHPAWPGTNPASYTPILGKFMPQIQNNFYYVESPISDSAGITFTLPMSNAFTLVDDYLWLKFYNRYDAVLLLSVCIVDGSEEHLNKLTSEDCHLNNPDFVTPPDPATDWTTEGVVEHHPLYGPNGGVQLDDGQVYQYPLIETPNVWQMEVRASGGSDDLVFGTQRSSLMDRGPQMKTETLEPGLRIYRNNIYVSSQDAVIVQSVSASVDYVCLMARSGILDMPDCNLDKPVWDPSGSGDPLLIYLFKFIGDMIEWGVCVLVSSLTVYVNYSVIMLEDFLLRIPALPNILSENFWEELQLFISLTVEGMTDYFQFRFDNLRIWIRDRIDELGRWWGWQLRRAGQWLNWLLYDVVQWLADQLGVPPQAIYDALYDIAHEARLFWLEMQAEIANEIGNAFQLLINMADVLIVLASGVREGVSGNTIAYIGGDFTGIGGFIWDGVSFVNEAVDLTPLSALNVLALGVITYGLMGWTGKKFTDMLEAFS